MRIQLLVGELKKDKKMNKKINITVLLLLFCLAGTAQNICSDTSEFWEIVSRNRLDTGQISLSEFDILCYYIKNNPDAFGRISNRFFAVGGGLAIFNFRLDSITNVVRVYEWHRRGGGEWLANGFYQVFVNAPLLVRADLFGVNTESILRSLTAISGNVRITKNVFGGFREGVAECLWLSEIRIGRERDIILNYKSVHNGQLHGDFSIIRAVTDTIPTTFFSTTREQYISSRTVNITPQDTLFHTQFYHGTGDFAGFYPCGALMFEGRLERGQPVGRWLFYIRNREGELEEIRLQIIENGETVSSQRFFANRPTSVQYVRQEPNRRRGLFRR